jgi:hypothetical protein
MHQPGSPGGHQGKRNGFEKTKVHFRETDVNVAVDKTRHHRAAAAIDDVGVRRLDRLVGCFPDRLAFNQKFESVLKLASFRFKELEVSK